MLDWAGQNSSVITAVTNIGMLLVWLFYAQLLFNSYQRQRRPRVLINKGIGHEDLDSPCLICNMSQESIFIYFITARLITSDGTYAATVTDCEDDAVGDKKKLSTWTRQGPLGSGECLDVFSFRLILERISRDAGIELHQGVPVDPNTELRALEFHVISIYGSDDAPFGAVRRFDISYNTERGTLALSPDTIDTQRKTSWAYRRKIRQWLESEL